MGAPPRAAAAPPAHWCAQRPSAGAAALGVSLVRSFDNKPLAVVDNLPGGFAALRPAELRALAAALQRIASECEAGQGQVLDTCPARVPSDLRRRAGRAAGATRRRCRAAPHQVGGDRLVRSRRQRLGTQVGSLLAQCFGRDIRGSRGKRRSDGGDRSGQQVDSGGQSSQRKERPCCCPSPNPQKRP